MSKALHKLYFADVYELAKTLVIKSVASAEAINSAIAALGYTVNSAIPSTWKYYLNLAGEYHSLDEEMRVVSFDTLEEIVFNKENLKLHRATAKAYTHGSTYYQALVSKYPKQRALILGILNPIDINKAIAADDHQVLWYDTSLVESNEENLIPELQRRIYAFFARWYNEAYGIGNDLYEATVYATLAARLPGIILGIRLNNCKSRFAHSFHVWSYLASKGISREYKGHLTTKQALWLYRNIDYVLNNAGKASTFESLIEHLLSNRNIPVSALRAVKNLESVLEKLVPSIDLVSEPLNLLDQQSSSKETTTITSVVEREIPLAKDNITHYAEDAEEAEYRLSHSLLAEHRTKVIESNAVDRSGSLPFQLIDILLNEWAHLSHLGRYRTSLTYQNPISGDNFTISAKDSFLLWLYCIGIVHDKPLEKLPVFLAKRVTKIAIPSEKEALALVPGKYLNEAVIKALWAGAPGVGQVVSTDAFHSLCYDIQQKMLERYDLATRQQNMFSRIYVEVVGDYFYQDVGLDFGAGVYYADWLKGLGLDFSELDRTSAGALASEVLKKATGSDLSVNYSLKEIQTALLKILAQLSSYTIHFLQTTASDPSSLIGSSDLRVGKISGTEAAHDWVKIPVETVYMEHTKEYSKDYTGSLKEGVAIVERASEYDYGKVDVGVEIVSRHADTDAVLIKVPAVGITVSGDQDSSTVPPLLDDELLAKVASWL